MIKNIFVRKGVLLSKVIQCLSFRRNFNYSLEKMKIRGWILFRMTNFEDISNFQIVTALIAPIEMTSFLVASGAKRTRNQKDTMESGIKLQKK